MLIPHELEKSLEKFRDMNLIVEGKRDKEVLESIGFENVFVIGGERLEDFVEKLPDDKEFVILTDFDDEGEKKNKKLMKLLQKSKRKINLRLRVFFKKLFLVSKVEEVKKFFNIKGGFYGEVSAINDKILNRSRFYRKWCSRKTRCHWRHFRTD